MDLNTQTLLVSNINSLLGLFVIQLILDTSKSQMWLRVFTICRHTSSVLGPHIGSILNNNNKKRHCILVCWKLAPLFPSPAMMCSHLSKSMEP